ncbi:MAG: hypothetical protein IJ833_06775 [Lachnospiraceae bacterium]|nr:hypothetical protein [Lachnospiraceae bacterium]
MSSKTKIVVLHMKELIYTGILTVVGIVLLVLLITAFGSGGKERTVSDSTTSEEPMEAEAAPTSSDSIYIPGIYTMELILGGQTVDVEVILSENAITSIRLVDLNDAVTTMYPLLQPTFDDIYSQILDTQSVENITYSTENKYTSLVLLEAIRNSVNKGCDGTDSKSKKEQP